MFRVNMFFFSLLLFFGNKQQDITSSKHFIIIQSDQDLWRLTNLMDTTVYMNGREQSRETVRMHMLILTFAVRMQ